MQYFMPTKIIEEKNVVVNHAQTIASYGKRALIVTGKQSASLTGALSDIKTAFEITGTEYVLFDQVQENPPVETIALGAEIGEACDFVVGIGGGSPIDAAKAIAVLIKAGGMDPYEALFEHKLLPALPVIAIPTTSGTGTETTPYAIITNHKLRTKLNFSSKVFPELALMDVSYFLHMPKEVRNNTCVDALTHLIESYMNTNANYYSDAACEEGFRLWGRVKLSLKESSTKEENMIIFMRASSIAGIAISQTGTSLPHGMGYPLTYEHGMAHGKANGVFMYAYLSACKNQIKVKRILELVGFESLFALGRFLQDLLGTFALTDEEVARYTDSMMSNEAKLKNHPDQVHREDIIRMYRNAMLTL